MAKLALGIKRQQLACRRAARSKDGILVSNCQLTVRVSKLGMATLFSILYSLHFSSSNLAYFVIVNRNH